MKSLLTRALSAVVAVVFVTSLAYFGREQGMLLLVLIAVLLASREGVRILFPEKTPRATRAFFWVLNLILFGLGAWWMQDLALSFALIAFVFLSATLFMHSRGGDLQGTAQIQLRGLLGFVYLGLFPAMAARLIQIPNGYIWFLFLMSVVFAGDTFAYLSGSRFGKTLLLPTVSPKKSWEGSAGGFAGSIMAALIFKPFLPHIAVPNLIILAVLIGLSGQVGDFFESLLKRVANQKDSGSLMPGHGGALDRIDGVLFASPLMLAGAQLLESLR